MSSFLWVFLGGGLGSVCRYGIARLLVVAMLDFPLATLVANTLACIVLGFMMGVEAKSGWSWSVKMLIMTGFCGGFSTFSTFSAETMTLLQSGQTGLAIWNIGISVILCLGCIYLGIKLAI